MSLKIVLSPSLSDIKLFRAQVDVLAALGGLESNSILVAPTPSVEMEASELAEKLRPMCRSYVCQRIAREPEGGWPYGPNIHFGRIVQLLQESANDEPWLNLEPDATPTQPGWNEDLITEYNLSKKPCMGVIRDTSEVWPGEDGRHMVGMGIYPANFHDMSSLWQHPQQNQPYDVFMRWVVVGNHQNQNAHHTNLIQHLRRTERYELDGDVILCHDCPPEKGVSAGGGKMYSVDPHAVVVHGCRDSSLAALVLKSLGVEFNAEPLTAEAQAANDEEELKRQMQINHKALFDRVEGALGEKTTLKSLSEVLGVDKKELRAALESEGSPFVVRPPILYVTRREQP